MLIKVPNGSHWATRLFVPSCCVARQMASGGSVCMQSVEQVDSELERLIEIGTISKCVLAVYWVRKTSHNFCQKRPKPH